MFFFLVFYRSTQQYVSGYGKIDDHPLLLQERNPNFHTCCVSLLVSEELFMELHLFLYAGSFQFQENQNTISVPNMKTTTTSSWTKVQEIWVFHISWRICKRFLQICNSGDLGVVCLLRDSLCSDLMEEILFYCNRWFRACPAAAVGGIDLSAFDSDLALCTCERTQILHLAHGLGECWQKEIIFIAVKLHQSIGAWGGDQVLVRV